MNQRLRAAIDHSLDQAVRKSPNDEHILAL